MKKLQFKRIGILIGATLLISISGQVYRNISQFRLIESQLVNDIQGSLDTALDEYYAEIAKDDVFTLTDNLQTFEWNETIGSTGDSISSRVTNKIFLKKTQGDSLPETDSDLGSNDFFSRIGKSKIILKALTSAEEGINDSTSTTRTERKLRFEMDSLETFQVDEINEINIFRGLEAADSLRSLKRLTNQIIISITRDSLDFEKINNYLQAELIRKNININYGLLHFEEDSLNGAYNESQVAEMPFNTVSKSTFLPRGQRLEMYFENTALTVLRRGIMEILTSILFLVVIAFAFYYLYQTIKNQKELADIKADLIGNITHEFKTPIATTLSAIEGIEQFNPNNDSEKTKRYLGISKMQMLKLNQMVEKLLETATLDSEQLGLKPEAIDPVPILKTLVQKYQTINPDKSIELILPSSIRELIADPFHFENVISNLLDNAQKYGGDEIRISLEQNGSSKIRVWDNGGNISSADQSRVFEQFYRVPKGNLHDVKGFGIGLYYVEKIIEKHGGKITLKSGKNSTAFTTIWP
jgi:signal transduction histidine kinase